jgi:hypothetical protein
MLPACPFALGFSKTPVLKAGMRDAVVSELLEIGIPHDGVVAGLVETTPHMVQAPRQARKDLRIAADKFAFI